MKTINYRDYWKEICGKAKNKTNEQLGFGIRIIAILVGIISSAIVSILLGNGLLSMIIKIALLTLLCNIVGWAFIWAALFIYHKFHEPVILHNNQLTIISNQSDEITELESKLNPKKINIDIKPYHEPSYLQAAKAGILISNNDNYEIFPHIKIVGDIKRTEYFKNRNINIVTVYLQDGNRIMESIEQIERNDAKPIIFAQVEKTKNVSFQFRNRHLFLTSWYDFTTGVSEIDQIRWEFSFEIYGTMNNEPYSNGIYSAYIDSFVRNNEIFVQMEQAIPSSGIIAH